MAGQREKWSSVCETENVKIGLLSISTLRSELCVILECGRQCCRVRVSLGGAADELCIRRWLQVQSAFPTEMTTTICSRCCLHHSRYLSLMSFPVNVDVHM